MTNVSPLNRNLTIMSQFLTAPVSLIQGKKVELLDTCRSTTLKVTLIALSAFCLIASLGFSFLIGSMCMRKKEVTLSLVAGSLASTQGTATLGSKVTPTPLGGAGVEPIVERSVLAGPQSPQEVLSLVPKAEGSGASPSGSTQGALTLGSKVTLIPLGGAGVESIAERSSSVIPSKKLDASSLLDESMGLIPLQETSVLAAKFTDEQIIKMTNEMVEALNNYLAGFDEKFFLQFKTIRDSKIPLSTQVLQKALLDAIESLNHKMVKILIHSFDYHGTFLYEKFVSLMDDPVEIDLSNTNREKILCKVMILQELVEKVHFTEEEKTEIFIKAFSHNIYFGILTRIFNQDKQYIVSVYPKIKSRIPLTNKYAGIDAMQFSLMAMANPAFAKALRSGMSETDAQRNLLISTPIWNGTSASEGGEPLAFSWRKRTDA